MTYDPFLPGPFRVSQHLLHARDAARNRVFPVDLWHPPDAEPPLPLIVFSHAAAQGRRSATYLCTHLASRGYAVAAMDHSEIVAPELGRPTDESGEERSRRWDAVIASRVPDVRFLLDHLLGGAASVALDESRIGLAGHSFGGWTVLAAPGADPRIRAVVAMAPGGASRPRPGILPATLTFDWGRDVPTLFLAAENDTSTPLASIVEIFERTPATKRMVILRRADHLHFLDDVEGWHERFRTMPVPPELAAIQKEMRPIGELHTGEQAHYFTRGLALAHFDATLKAREDARQFLDRDLEARLSEAGVEASVHGL